jgi:hypothetical protein
MEDFILESTVQTPSLHFSEVSGIMSISGRAIPNDPEEFWSGALDWFDSYLSRPNQVTEFRIDLEYFNISSSKRILYLLYKLNELVDKGLQAKVNWFYKETDEDMYEVGQDYEYMIKVPFEFIAYTDIDLSLAY